MNAAHAHYQVKQINKNPPPLPNTPLLGSNLAGTDPAAKRKPGVLPWVSLALYVISLFVPGGNYEGIMPGVLCFFIGPFLIGTLMAPANLCFVAGWAALISGSRKATIVLALLALLVGVVGGAPSLIAYMLPYPAYFLWIGSFLLLLWAGCALPKATVDRRH
jgi:hypothetical protein